MSTLLILLLVLLVFLAWERSVVSRTRKKIPLVITVTGTRGKSSVARALGSVLRAHHRRVLVKTTGTESQFLLPDGSIQEIARRGLPTILEQKAVLSKAVRHGAEVLIAEIMSIEPENHLVESHRILRPDIVVITNIRRDHTESMGNTVEEIAETIMLDVVPGSRVFAPQSQSLLFHPSQGVTWHEVPMDDAATSGEGPAHASRFAENDRLVSAVARSLDVPEETIQKGLGETTADRGGFTIWQYAKAGKTVYLVNAFAANDPESTFALLERSRALLGRNQKVHGLFTLRSDRGARTLQWIEALESEQWSFLRGIFVAGDSPRSVSRRIRRSVILSQTDAAFVTARAITRMEDGGILFGFGNTHGMGLQLVDHWTKEGTIYGT